MFKRLFIPVALLALLLITLITTSPQAAQVRPVSKAVSAPSAVAAPVADRAPVPAALPTPASVATPAVATPATLAFAKGADGLSPKVLAMALDAVACAKSRGISGRDDVITVIDYSLPSTQPRLWVLDLKHGEVLFHELVAHGRGSGENYATNFSNGMNSHQTSLGLFLTGGTYQGGNGYSLKLKGLDQGVNDLAEERAIVMHGAWYVSPEQARSQGRLGRSWGCPALSEASAPKVINAIKGGSFVFSYGGSEDWIQKASSSLKSCPATPDTNAVAATAVSVAG